MAAEIWKPIKGTNPAARVSNLGRVQQIKVVDGTAKWVECKTRPKTGAYWYVRLANSRKGSEERRLHRVVAEAFLNNEEGFTDVNHIDEDKANNAVSNLEWCDHKHNQRHSSAKQRKGAARARHVKKMTLIQRSDGRIFGSISDAAFYTKISKSTIQNCLNGDIKTAGGFGFKRVTRDEISGTKQIEINFD